MKKIAFSTILALSLLSTATIPGCATTGGANTDVVVNAEKTLRTAKDTFDLFLHLEYDNQALVKAKLPAVHSFAEYLRRNAPTWLSTANDLKNTYKHNGDKASLAALQSALSTISNAITQSQQNVIKINGAP